MNYVQHTVRSSCRHPSLWPCKSPSRTHLNWSITTMFPSRFLWIMCRDRARVVQSTLLVYITNSCSKRSDSIDILGAPAGTTIISTHVNQNPIQRPYPFSQYLELKLVDVIVHNGTNCVRVCVTHTHTIHMYVLGSEPSARRQAQSWAHDASPLSRPMSIIVGHKLSYGQTEHQSGWMYSAARRDDRPDHWGWITSSCPRSRRMCSVHVVTTVHAYGSVGEKGNGACLGLFCL